MIRYSLPLGYVLQNNVIPNHFQKKTQGTVGSLLIKFLLRLRYTIKFDFYLRLSWKIHVKSQCIELLWTFI